MATIDSAKRFAEQSVKVERILRQAGVTGNIGRTILVLTMVNTALGVSQKEVGEQLALTKDVVSKLVTSLVEAKLLTQEDHGTNSRRKSLAITDSGRRLLSQLKTSLQQGRRKTTERKLEPTTMSLFEAEA